MRKEGEANYLKHDGKIPDTVGLFLTLMEKSMSVILSRNRSRCPKKLHTHPRSLVLNPLCGRATMLVVCERLNSKRQCVRWHIYLA